LISSDVLIAFIVNLLGLIVGLEAAGRAGRVNIAAGWPICNHRPGMDKCTLYANGRSGLGPTL
jgi:hypothetical protein